MQIINQSRNTIIARHAEMADTVIARLQGLLGRESLLEDQALVITQCRSIHMFFMRFSIDVIFVDKRNQVVGLVKRIKPFRLSPYFFRASCAIELPQGVIEKTRTGVGDTIVLS